MGRPLLQEGQLPCFSLHFARPIFEASSPNWFSSRPVMVLWWQLAVTLVENEMSWAATKKLPRGSIGNWMNWHVASLNSKRLSRGGHWGQEASNWTKLADAFWWPWCRTSRWEEISKAIHQPSDENGDNQQHLGNTGNWSCRSSMTDLGEAKVSKIWGDIAEVCCGQDATLICVMIYRGSDLNMIHWKCISLFIHSFFGWFIACNYLGSCLVVIACYCWMYLFSFRYSTPVLHQKNKSMCLNGLRGRERESERQRERDLCK